MLNRHVSFTTPKSILKYTKTTARYLSFKGAGVGALALICWMNACYNMTTGPLLC